MLSTSWPGSTNAKRRRRIPLALLALVVACGGDAPAPAVPASSATTTVVRPAAPEGTALLVDDVPVPANEVDRWADWITTLEPEYVLNARRRFALTNGLLERAAIASKFAADRELARERIERASGGTPQTAPRLAAGLVSSTVSGLWTDLGLQLWGELQPIELERWVGPFELPGSFTLARVVEHKTNRGLDELTVELLQAPFLPTSDTHKAITKAVDTSSLQIVDDAFDDAVPESWKLRMRGPR